jgi:hypothetical protein
MSRPMRAGSQERINCDAIGNIVVRGLVKVVKVGKVGPSPLCWNLVVSPCECAHF